MSSSDSSSWSELEALALSAQTPEDLKVIAELVAERESVGSGATSARWVVKTQSEVAEFFGVTIQGVGAWRANGMPGDEGRWDLQAITQWRCARLNENASNGKTQEERDIDLELKRVELAKEQLKFAITSGSLVDREEAIAKLADILNQCRVQLEAIPGIIGGVIPPEIRADVVHEIEQQIRLICRQMASQAG